MLPAQSDNPSKEKEGPPPAQPRGVLKRPAGLPREDVSNVQAVMAASQPDATHESQLLADVPRRKRTQSKRSSTRQLELDAAAVQSKRRVTKKSVEAAVVEETNLMAEVETSRNTKRKTNAVVKAKANDTRIQADGQYDSHKRQGKRKLDQNSATAERRAQVKTDAQQQESIVKQVKRVPTRAPAKTCSKVSVEPKDRVKQSAVKHAKVSVEPKGRLQQSAVKASSDEVTSSDAKRGTKKRDFKSKRQTMVLDESAKLKAKSEADRQALLKRKFLEEAAVQEAKLWAEIEEEKRAKHDACAGMIPAVGAGAAEEELAKQRFLEEQAAEEARLRAEVEAEKRELAKKKGDQSQVKNMSRPTTCCDEQGKDQGPAHVEAGDAPLTTPVESGSLLGRVCLKYNLQDVALSQARRAADDEAAAKRKFLEEAAVEEARLWAEIEAEKKQLARKRLAEQAAAEEAKLRAEVEADAQSLAHDRVEQVAVCEDAERAHKLESRESDASRKRSSTEAMMLSASAGGAENGQRCLHAHGNGAMDAAVGVQSAIPGEPQSREGNVEPDPYALFKADAHAELAHITAAERGSCERHIAEGAGEDVSTGATASDAAPAAEDAEAAEVAEDEAAKASGSAESAEKVAFDRSVALGEEVVRLFLAKITSTRDVSAQDSSGVEASARGGS
eukprot:TRINITY_DN21112_c0_g1_i2.p1 TRINITY_DN21112_c0_g1~~TRINITY_DN21112_c0_g1_i2.p1  ORF type:complete len:674 (+),score=138.68 TRINITY_DN21112_c0_g1_i2:390-2411(+)